MGTETSERRGLNSRKVSRRGLLQGAAGATVGAGASLALVACGGSDSGAAATATPGSGPSGAVIGPVEQQRQRRMGTGLKAWDPSKTFDGYTLFAPFQGQAAYLVDMEGQEVHRWQVLDGSTDETLFSVRLLASGNIFVVIHQPASDAPPFVFKGSVMRELDWNGNVVWEAQDADQHHDALVLESGNLLVLRTEALPADIEAQVQGGLPPQQEFGMWADYVVEMTKEGETVWEWHAYEHLDPALDVINDADSPDQWTHGNGIVQMPHGDVIISFRNINLGAAISRQTGDLTWRLGPPEVAQQHNPTVLPNGNILLFDNGAHRLDNALPFSRVIEVDPATSEIVWQYQDPTLLNFFSPLVSGAQRLPNGNTMISEGNFGRLFEVTAEGELVWEYVSPFFTVNAFLGEGNTLFRAYRHAADEFLTDGTEL